LYSCIASESQKFFKRVFYFKKINFITRGPLAEGARGNCPRFPPLIRPWAQPGSVSNRHDRFLLIGPRAKGSLALRLLTNANLHFLSQLLV